MFIAALFKITKRWKQHKCLSTEEWIKRMWNAMEYYPAIKKNEIMLLVTSREASGVPCLNPRRGLTLLSPVGRDPAIGV